MNDKEFIDRVTEKDLHEQADELLARSDLKSWLMEQLRAQRRREMLASEDAMAQHLKKLGFEVGQIGQDKSVGFDSTWRLERVGCGEYLHEAVYDFARRLRALAEQLEGVYK